MTSYIQDKQLKKYIAKLILISATITIFLIFYGLPRIIPYLTKFSAFQIIGILTVLISMIGVTWEIIKFKFQHIPILKIDLNITVYSENLALITSKLENFRGRTMSPDKICIFIDEGILKDEKHFNFPFLLKKEPKKYYCLLSNYLQDKQFDYTYPKSILKNEFQDCFSDCIELKNFSYETVIRIASGEIITEDVVIKLPHSGVYRATLIFKAKNADCLCTSREFIIPDNSKKE